MDIVEFEEWLDRLGDDISKWPHPQRDDAQILLATSQKARALFAEAKVLRSALVTAPVKAPAGLADRIVAAAAITPASVTEIPVPDREMRNWIRGAGFVTSSYRPPAIFLSLCFVIGLLIGLFNSPQEVDGFQVDLPSYVAHVVDTAHDTD